MNGSSASQSISIVIPTLGRDEVLLETIESLLPMLQQDDELLIVDQTTQHDPETERQMSDWNSAGSIRWIRQSPPSIPRAMNRGLLEASNALVLFLDDDIHPHPQLLEGHRVTHQSDNYAAVVGQVIQPWQAPTEVTPPHRRKGLKRDFDFPFHTTLPAADIGNVMAGNLCVRKKDAIKAGGFDENFVGSAYRFETEFARRLIREGGTIAYCPIAGIDHLRVSRGGTRVTGNHQGSADPKHGVGDYYFALQQGVSFETLKYMAIRPFREVRTKYHLMHPWMIPVKLLGEFRAIIWALQMWGASKLIDPSMIDSARNSEQAVSL